MIRCCIYFLVMIYICLLLACSSTKEISLHQNNRLAADWCTTKYPVVLIHGIALKDKTAINSYWGKIPEHLQALGCTTYFGGQNAYDSHKKNAEAIAQRIDLILTKHNTDKVNIIAHSKGGIEARYLITLPGYENKVASLTTLCTPHRGSSIADLIFAETEKNHALKGILVMAASMQAIYIGDFYSAPYKAGKQLTTFYMEQFNKEVPDSEIVYYQSYSARILPGYEENFLKSLSAVLYQYEGDNDGLTSVSSARWGNYKGLILETYPEGLSHADVIDIFPGDPGLKHRIYDFYIELVHDLKIRGY